MTQRILDQCSEVLIRYLAYGPNTDATCFALNLLQNYVQEDSPEEYQRITSEAFKAAIEELSG